MKKKFSFQHKVSKKTVRNLRIVTVYEEVMITGEAKKGWASNPVTEKSEPWYCVDIESVLWRNTNVYPLLQMVADYTLDDIQEAAEKHARTVFSQPAVKPCIDPQDEAGKLANAKLRAFETRYPDEVNRYLYE